MPRWVVVGPGDDAAVIEPERGALDVLTTDAQVEGIHFDRRFVPADAVGHRALAVNLSDLAAMGARPRAALLSLILPGALATAELDAMLDGLLALAGRHGITLIGGNITRSPGPLVLDVTAIGSVRPRRILTRSGARAGDDVYVTGTVGDAATGLRSLQLALDAAPPDGVRAGTEAGDDGADAAPAGVARYLRPEPRVRAGLLLGRNRAASSCMDLSDGLADAARQIAAASGVGMIVEESALPISDEARRWHERRGSSAVDAALRGGDDYELLFTVRSTQRGRLRGVQQQIGNLPITRIGVVTKGREVVVHGAQGNRALPRGFEHFR